MITRAGWVKLGRGLWGALARVFDGDLTTIAGGMALFSLLATIPTIAAIVAMYSLVVDPSQLNAQLAELHRVMPRAVVTFLTEQLTRPSQSSAGNLATTLLTSMVVALYAARGAVNAGMHGLNVAYGRVEHRTWWRRTLAALALATGAIASFVILIFIIVALPSALRLLHAPDSAALVAALRWPVLLLFVGGLFATLYRIAPATDRERGRAAVWPGALAGTSVWLAVSMGLSLWVERIANYEILYGAFAGVIVLILWFYASAMALLFGAAVNAQLADAR